MIRALFTAADGMIIQERKQAVISNNITNSNTAGYKAQNAFSKEIDKAMMFTLQEAPSGKVSRNEIGEMSLGSEIDEIYFNFEQGMIQETEKPTDLALEGSGFFKVQWEDGVAYTRNGNFKTDGEGYLVMQDNQTRLLVTNLQTGQEEPLMIGDREMTVDTTGRISLDGVATHQIQPVTIQPGVNIEAVGNSIFTVAAGNEVPAQGTLIRQKQLERSNVNVIDEMVKMIEASRSFESGQKIITTLDNTLSRVVSEVGRVR